MVWKVNSDNFDFRLLLFYSLELWNILCNLSIEFYEASVCIRIPGVQYGAIIFVGAQIWASKSCGSRLLNDRRVIQQKFKPSPKLCKLCVENSFRKHFRKKIWYVSYYTQIPDLCIWLFLSSKQRNLSINRYQLIEITYKLNIKDYILTTMVEA